MHIIDPTKYEVEPEIIEEGEILTIEVRQISDYPSGKDALAVIFITKLDDNSWVSFYELKKHHIHKEFLYSHLPAESEAEYNICFDGL